MVNFEENLLVSASGDGTLITHCFPLEEIVRPPDNELTPLIKMEKNMFKSNKIPVVLIECGAFSPPHVKHVEMLEVAKKFLELNGYYVVEGK